MGNRQQATARVKTRHPWLPDFQGSAASEVKTNANHPRHAGAGEGHEGCNNQDLLEFCLTSKTSEKCGSEVATSLPFDLTALESVENW